ncbi:IS3 family transposase [Cellulophaga sp. E16_2]|uniref:IS3 family transposase n=1 Tax=Cellulophaga sp. E16_2 TaxID=2789297 RepID=UPI003211AE07
MFTRVDYSTFGETGIILKRYIEFYNNIRIHGLLGRITPMDKRNLINRIINNRNLKEYSCFIGVKNSTDKGLLLIIQF